MAAVPSATPAPARGLRGATILVVTASNLRQAAAIEKELQSRKSLGAIPKDWLVFTVPDPSAARVGSGGATLNALVTVNDLLTASDVSLADSLVFMIHSGGDSQRLPSNSVCGKAWCSFPSLGVQDSLNAPIDLLLELLVSMFRSVRTGLVVSCSDVLLLFPEAATFDWSRPGVTGLAIPMPKSYGPNHGVYHVDKAVPSGTPATVTKFFQKSSVDDLTAAGAVRGDDTVLLDCGVVYCDDASTAALLELAQRAPLDACTYMGPENGAGALRVELYSDIMMALGGGVGLTHSQYMALGTSEKDATRIAVARELLWKTFNDTPFWALCVDGSRMSHVGTTTELLDLLTTESDFRGACRLQARAACYDVMGSVRSLSEATPGSGAVEHVAKVAPAPSPAGTASAAAAGAGEGAAAADEPRTNVVMNSLLRTPGHLGAGAVVEHCELSGSWSIGDNALCSTVRTLPGVRVRSGMALQEVHVSGHRVVSLWGVNDPIKHHYKKDGATLCHQPWADIMRMSGLTADDIWKDVPEDQRTLWTARVFPMFPLPESHRHSDVGSGGAADGVVAAGGDASAALGAGSGVGPSSAGTTLEGFADGSGWGSTRVRSQAAAVADRDASLWLQDVAHTNYVAVERWRSTRRLSFKELLQAADASTEFVWRRQLRDRIEVAHACRAIRARADIPLKRALRRLVEAEGGGGNAAFDNDGNIRFTKTQLRTLAGLDETAATAPFDVAAHALSIISEVLWGIAGWGGLLGGRSGPARHVDWAPALSLLARCGDDESVVGGEPTTASGSSSPTFGPSAFGIGGVTQRTMAINELARQRERWSTHRHLIGRAARHYERAAQILVSKCVSTALVSHTPVAPAPIGEWVTASAAARVDLAGGWSDTPPITFEARSAAAVSGDEDGGGIVTNVAVRVDGKRPIGTRVRRIEEPVVVIRECDTAPAERVADAKEIRSERKLRTLADFDDHDSPTAPAALVKCALLSVGAVALIGDDIAFVSTTDSLAASSADHPNSLPRQLKARCGAGLEIETWSKLPAGSGMGTSSILAGTVLAAVGRAIGRQFDRATLTMLTLRLEQILTTGGGWQDQVGGLYGGVKTGYCPAVLPLSVRVVGVPGSSVGGGAGASRATSPAPLGGGALSGGATGADTLFQSAGGPASAVGGAAAVTGAGATKMSTVSSASGEAGPVDDMLNKHLVLVYTGKTRLAKNLLQRVLRQWALRDDGIPELVGQLCTNAESARRSLQACDIGATGTALSLYWEQKKRMAPGCEPEEVATMLHVLGPHVHGASMCGAGGGGFLAVLVKVSDASDGAAEVVRQILSANAATRELNWTVHTATVDTEGLRVVVGEDGAE